MKWLNIKFILHTFLGLLCVTSGLFRNHTNGNNAPSKSVANMQASTVKQVVHIGIEKYSEMLNGDLYQNCDVKKFREGKPLSTEDKILIQEAEREAYNVKIDALIQAALSNFREIDYIMESIFDPENVCNEFSADTFNNILEYRNILSSVLHRLYICDVTSITRKMANRRKPDYEYVFSTDLTTGKGVKIYAEIQKDPSQSKILHTIVGLLDNTVSLINKIPEMCNVKWFIEKTIECLNLYECNYVHGFKNGLDEQWFKFEDVEKNHDEEKVVKVVVDDNTHKDTELVELME